MAPPTSEVLAWAADAVATGSAVVKAIPMREGGAPWRLSFRGSGNIEDVVLRVGNASDPEDVQRFRTECAALGVAEAHGLRTPRVLAADLEGSTAGGLALVITTMPGRSRIPRVATPARLRALGAAVVPVESVPLAPTADLPLRRRSLDTVDFAGMRSGTASAQLLARATDVIQNVGPAASPTCLIHADLWQGNTMWVGDELAGVIDWECSGVGHVGLDIGNLRCDAALMFGAGAPEIVQEGWAGAGGEVESMAYWDVVAALSTPPDLSAWHAPIHDQGRTDLLGKTLNARRDEFLQSALSQLG